MGFVKAFTDDPIQFAEPKAGSRTVKKFKVPPTIGELTNASWRGLEKGSYLAFAGPVNNVVSSSGSFLKGVLYRNGKAIEPSAPHLILGAGIQNGIIVIAVWVSSHVIEIYALDNNAWTFLYKRVLDFSIVAKAPFNQSATKCVVSCATGQFTSVNRFFPVNEIIEFTVDVSQGVDQASVSEETIYSEISDNIDTYPDLGNGTTTDTNTNKPPLPTAEEFADRIHTFAGDILLQIFPGYENYDVTLFPEPIYVNGLYGPFISSFFNRIQDLHAYRLENESNAKQTVQGDDTLADLHWPAGYRGDELVIPKERRRRQRNFVRIAAAWAGRQGVHAQHKTQTVGANASFDATYEVRNVYGLWHDQSLLEVTVDMPGPQGNTEVVRSSTVIEDKQEEISPILLDLVAGIATPRTLVPGSSETFFNRVRSSSHIFFYNVEISLIGYSLYIQDEINSIHYIENHVVLDGVEVYSQNYQTPSEPESAIPSDSTANSTQEYVIDCHGNVLIMFTPSYFFGDNVINGFFSTLFHKIDYFLGFFRKTEDGYVRDAGFEDFIIEPGFQFRGLKDLKII